jgi:hypothetical protein
MIMSDQEIWEKNARETQSDIYVGLEEDKISEKTILFSIGHRCTSASLIKHLNLKFESYPFDWVVSKLEVIIDCIETDYQHYLNSDNYNEKQSETFNLSDGKKRHICFENIVYNNYYESAFLENFDGNVENNYGTYGMMLSLTHHDIRNQEGLAYFQRCVQRFKKMLALPGQKFYLYVHPLLGNQEFQLDSARLINYFIEFVDKFKTKSPNLFGIFFVVVKNNDKKFQIDKLFETKDVVIFVLYVNDNLIDGGGVYDGDFFQEQHNMLNAIQDVIRCKQET